jgi:hypothetical protein
MSRRCLFAKSVKTVLIATYAINSCDPSLHLIFSLTRLSTSFTFISPFISFGKRASCWFTFSHSISPPLE